MKKIYFNRFFIASLITAFLALQWASTHIHLAEQHAHDGGQHRHAATTHKHLLTNYHSDAFDIASNASLDVDHSNIVELEHTCTTSISKLHKHIAIINSSIIELVEQACFSCDVEIANIDQPPYDYHQYSTTIRGPPLTA